MSALSRAFIDSIFFVLNKVTQKRQWCTNILVINKTKQQTDVDTNNSVTNKQENGRTDPFPRFITSLLLETHDFLKSLLKQHWKQVGQNI